MKLQLPNRAYINYTVQEEEKTSGIAILPRRGHQVHVAVLYEHVRYSIIVHHWILWLRIPLRTKFNNKLTTLSSIKFKANSKYLSIT